MPPDGSVRVNDTDDPVVSTPPRLADVSDGVVGVLVAVSSIGDGASIEVAMIVPAGVAVAGAVGVPVPVGEIVLVVTAVGEDNGVSVADGLSAVPRVPAPVRRRTPLSYTARVATRTSSTASHERASLERCTKHCPFWRSKRYAMLHMQYGHAA
jgi:hypothetical protein